MELWLLFAFAAPFFWGFTAVIEKFLLDKHMKDPMAANIYFEIAIFVIGLSLLLFADVIVSPINLLLILAVGSLNFATFLLFFKAIKVEDVSRVMMIWFLYPVFAILFSFLFLGEVVGTAQYIGAAFLISSSVLVSFTRNAGKVIVSPAMKYLLLANVIGGALVTFEKFILNSVSQYALLFWSNASVFAVAVALLAFSAGYRKGFVRLLRLRKKVTATIWLSNVFNTVACLAFFTALSLGPASLVSSINAVQPFFVLLMVLLLTALWPHILKEEHTKGTLFLKLLAIAAVFLGTYLIAM